MHAFGLCCVYVCARFPLYSMELFTTIISQPFRCCIIPTHPPRSPRKLGASACNAGGDHRRAADHVWCEGARHGMELSHHSTVVLLSRLESFFSPSQLLRACTAVLVLCVMCSSSGHLKARNGADRYATTHLLPDLGSRPLPARGRTFFFSPQGAHFFIAQRSTRTRA